MTCCNNKNKKETTEKSCCSNSSKENGNEEISSFGELEIEVLDKKASLYTQIKQKITFWRRISGALSLVLIVSIAFQFSGMSFVNTAVTKITNSEIIPRAYASEVLPKEGVSLPITWGDLGKQMIDAGVIDKEKFEKLYERRGGMGEDAQNLLYGTNNKTVVINSENSGEILNLMWAFGLSNKNSILENGPMTTYDGKKSTSREEALSKAGRMASTGGWPLSVGNPMDHYSAHEFVTLTDEEWKLVERVASGIYRPCCNNPTHFPDCNHGMAMLGLLELLADKGLTESEMFDIALSVNSYWFPDTYITIAKYMDINGTQWSDVDSKEVLGPKYSSGSGFASVKKALDSLQTGAESPVNSGSGGGCGA